MRTSVYIPKELEDRVKEAHPTRGWSDLVQAALTEYIEERESPPEFARERPPTNPGQLERIRERLLAEAREYYEIGYRRGVQVGEHIKWWMLDSLAQRYAWDVHRWLDATSEDVRADGKVVAVPLGTLLGLDEFGLANTSMGLGFTHALKDLWESVVASHDAEANEEVAGEDGAVT